jgi:hypothetical protein
VAVTGSRALAGRDDEVWAAFLDGMRELAGALPDAPPYRYLHGGASGVDRIVDRRLRAAGKEVLPPLLPDYEQHGRRAPIVRDEDLVLAADGLVAVWDGRSNGTHYTVSRARHHRVPHALRTVEPHVQILAPQPGRPGIGTLRLRCRCGQEHSHPADAPATRCPRCGHRDRLNDIRGRPEVLL